MMADPPTELAGRGVPEIHRLEDRVELLALATAALAELVMEKLGITEEELAARITEIDGRDGVVDGRRLKRPRPCTSCSAMVAADRDTCQFCGAAQPDVSPLDKI